MKEGRKASPPPEASEFQIKAADAAMFATANLSIGGFDVRALMFDVRGLKSQKRFQESAYFIVVADGVKVEQCR